jgi:hypothetical protein
MGYLAMNENADAGNCILVTIITMGIYGLGQYVSYKDAENEGSSSSDVWPVIILICCCSPLCAFCALAVAAATGAADACSNAVSS